MSEAVVVTCAAEIRQAVRARIVELGITYETVDEIAGFQPRYTNKLLCEPPMKNFRVDSLFALLGALALDPMLRHDEKRLEKLQKRADWLLRKRNGSQYVPRMHTVSVHKPLTIQLGPELLAEMRAKGGRNSRKYMGKRKRKQLARKAALVRWSDVKAAAKGNCEKC